MVLFHIVGSGQAFNWGGLSWTLGAGPAATDAELNPPTRQAPMIHGIQLGSGRSSVCFAFFGEADVPSLSAALTGGRDDSLAA